MKFNKFQLVLLVLGLVFNLCSALPKPQDGGTETEPNPPAPGNANAGKNQPEAENKDKVAPAPVVKPDDVKPVGASAATAEPVNDDCDTDCKLGHQTTIIIFICILVCIILLIVILFGCYFMKKLHGKAILTTDHNQIIHRRGPKKTMRISPDTFEKRTETRTVDTGNPNESKVITTTTTKIVSTTSDESA